MLVSKVFNRAEIVIVCYSKEILTDTYSEKRALHLINPFNAHSISSERKKNEQTDLLILQRQ